MTNIGNAERQRRKYARVRQRDLIRTAAIAEIVRVGSERARAIAEAAIVEELATKPSGGRTRARIREEVLDRAIEAVARQCGGEARTVAKDAIEAQRATVGKAGRPRVAGDERTSRGTSSIPVGGARPARVRQAARTLR